ncbi:MAG TPA: cytochrome P460 family protein [Pyrinomonadaceae bacterium]|nr:cytochrome P460 family protein [Pyrinomonadaceae bacterium]
MKTPILRHLLLIPALALTGCAVATKSSPGVPESDLAKLANYRRWTLVNPTPQLMAPLPAISCAIIPGRNEPSPHLNKYVSVFVNPVGREEMMTMHHPKFPVGTMIVKEKHGSPDSTKPELLTAMIKRGPGYNPESGDWEYLVLDGAASKIVEQGKLTRCSGCHNLYQRTDFVTRTYLPETVRNELKP